MRSAMVSTVCGTAAGVMVAAVVASVLLQEPRGTTAVLPTMMMGGVSKDDGSGIGGSGKVGSGRKWNVGSEKGSRWCDVG